MNPTQNYDPISKPDADLWCVSGDWYDTALRRRMTLIRDSDGSVLVHSPVLLGAKDLEELNAWGRVRWIVAPNRFHCSEVLTFAESFPEAEIWASPLALNELKNSTRTIHPLQPTQKFGSTITALEFGGTRWLGEWVFHHASSRTLIVTDLVFNLPDPRGRPLRSLERIFLRWNRISSGMSPSRLFELVFLKDRKRAEDSVREILKWDFRRVVMSHGAVCENEGHAQFRSGFQGIGFDV